MRTLNKIALASLVLGASYLGAMPAHASGNYYDEFGERHGIKVMTDDFVDYLLTDDRIKAYFTNANIPVLKASLANQFCKLEGGPCAFNANMKDIHKNLGVTEAAFNALAEDLQKSMNQHHIPLAAQNDLLSKLAPMERDVVTK